MYHEQHLTHCLPPTLLPSHPLPGTPTEVMKPVGVEVCEGCGRSIQDRFIMRVIDTSWHEDCLVCCVCRVQLQHSCFARDNKIYCKLDYDR